MKNLTRGRDIQFLADQILAPLRASSSDAYIGEEISQLEHALQCAHWANKHKADDEAVLAALCHDIGHIIPSDSPHMDNLGRVNHERIGQEFLVACGCSKRLGYLVGGHVLAKRYLCFKKDNYFGNLSDASKETLQWQGGPMLSSEAGSFEEDDDFKTLLSLRAWDELAKDPNAQVAPLESYRERLEQHIYTQKRT